MGGSRVCILRQRQNGIVFRLTPTMTVSPGPRRGPVGNLVSVIYNVRARLGYEMQLEEMIQSWMCGKRFRAVAAYDLSDRILFRKI